MVDRVEAELKNAVTKDHHSDQLKQVYKFINIASFTSSHRFISFIYILHKNYRLMAYFHCRIPVLCRIFSLVRIQTLIP